MCELRTYLASYKWLICGMFRMSQYIGNHSTNDSSTCVVMKIKSLPVVRRDILWQIVRMDKCLCVVHLFYTCGLMPLVFLLLHMRVTYVAMPFQLWVICTACK